MIKYRPTLSKMHCRIFLDIRCLSFASSNIIKARLNNFIRFSSSNICLIQTRCSQWSASDRFYRVDEAIFNMLIWSNIQTMQMEMSWLRILVAIGEDFRPFFGFLQCPCWLWIWICSTQDIYFSSIMLIRNQNCRAICY